MSLTKDDIAEIIKRFDERQKTKTSLFSPEKAVAETVKHLKEQGVPDEINAPIAAMMLGRFRERRLMADIAKKLIPIQELPPGALPIYDRKPEGEE